MKMIDILRESSSLKNKKGITLIALIASTKCSQKYILK